MNIRFFFKVSKRTEIIYLLNILKSSVHQCMLRDVTHAGTCVIYIHNVKPLGWMKYMDAFTRTFALALIAGFPFFFSLLPFSECSLQAWTTTQNPSRGEHSPVSPVQHPDDSRAILRTHGFASHRGRLRYLHRPAKNGHR